DSSPARTTSELAPIRTRVTRPLPACFLSASLSSFTDDDFNLNGFATPDYRYCYRFANEIWFEKGLQTTNVPHGCAFESYHHITDQHACLTAGSVRFRANND